MSDIETGGSAFPKQPIYDMPNNVQLVTEQEGMTLRDYFAAKALSGFFVAGNRYGSDDYMAKDAYEIADAMLKARGE